MPVHLATVSATSSSSTSSFSILPPLWIVAQPRVLRLEALLELVERAVLQLRRLLEVAAALRVGHGERGRPPPPPASC